MGVVSAPNVMAKEEVICFADGSCKKGTWVQDDVFCFDGICTGRPKVWTPELGEVDASKYRQEELRKILDDFWTPERIKNARAVEVITEDGVGRRALLADGLILDKKQIPPDASEEMIASRDFWTPERLRKALPIGVAPLGAVVRGVRDVPDISISIEEKGENDGTAPVWIGGVEAGKVD